MPHFAEHLRTLRDLTRTRMAMRDVSGRLATQGRAQEDAQAKLNDLAAAGQATQATLNALAAAEQATQAKLNALAAAEQERAQATQAKLNGLAVEKDSLRESLDSLRRENSALQQRHADLEQTLQSVMGQMARELARLNGIHDAQRRSYVEITRQFAAAPSSEAAPQRRLSQDPFLDIFYREFEDRYRGSREEIALRLRAYVERLSFLKEADPETLRIVDLGCGRGEWLEVLRDEGLPAIGVDNNEAQAEAAQHLGLNVEIDDAIAWLSRQNDRSFDFISAFHLIEHLEFPVLAHLLKEALRVLKPGGGLLLETPNPESLIVGAYKFWFDPTHIRPYPSELIAQLLETLTFKEIDVLRLHPDGRNQEYKLRGLPDPVADLMVGPLDYGILARRP